MNKNEEESFLQNFPTKKISIIDEKPQVGPDNWPYLMVKDEGTEPVTKVLEWLSQKGIGMVFNPKDPYPDYVFTYGMVWSFCEFGRFTGYKFQEERVKKKSEKIIAAAPSEEFLPMYVRKIIRQFLQDQGVLQPKILAITKESDPNESDLCFSLSSLGNPPKEEHMGICEALAWFLPADLSIALVEEKGLPEFTIL